MTTPAPNAVAQPSKIFLATHKEKNFWNFTRETGKNMIKRKLITLVTLAKGALGEFDMVANILFWPENVKITIAPYLQITLVWFQKFFPFRVAGIILYG